MDEIRVDKFLWCVRLYKTRSIATEECRKGKIRINDEPVKPSRTVSVNEKFSIHDKGIVRTFKILSLLKNRVGAKLVPDHLKDLTPEKEYSKLTSLRSRGFERRERGSGRPTKRERRDIDKLKGKDS